MFARVATLEGGSSEKLREFLDQQKKVENMGLPQGVRRAISLAGENRRLFITFFDSRDAIAAAEPAFDAMGGDVPDQARGRRTSVEVFEILADESF